MYPTQPRPSIAGLEGRMLTAKLAHQAMIAKGRDSRLGVCPQLMPLKARLGRKWSQLEFVRPTGFVLGV